MTMAHMLGIIIRMYYVSITRICCTPVPEIRVYPDLYYIDVVYVRNCQQQGQELHVFVVCPP